MANRVAVTVVRCWTDGTKRCREKCGAGTRGIGAGDTFFVEWRDPAGRRRMQRIAEPGRPGKLLADRRAAQLREQLTLGKYDDRSCATWREFRTRFEDEGMVDLRAESRRVMSDALNHLERLCAARTVREIDAQAIDRYKARRSQERGLAKESRLSPATLNKELRMIKRALRTAERWEYIERAPHIVFARTDEELPRFVNSEDFAKIYEACKTATIPADLGCESATWWRALIFVAYTTGWRIGELLTLRRADVNATTGEVTLRAANTKGRKAARIVLPQETIAHLSSVRGWGDVFFDWPHNKKTLYDEFARIQTAAGISLVCPIKHAHDAGCSRYGFHDLRRSFASMNATRLTATELQQLMRHSSFTTTLRYINMADSMQGASAKVFRPDVAGLTDSQGVG